MDKYLTDKVYWEKRAKGYDKLKWTKREKYISAFIKMCEASKKDIVLDLGTGTGTIAYAISPKVKSVIGVDYSDDMLQEAKRHNHIQNVNFIKADIRKMPFDENIFTKAAARMVFHHLIWGINRAIEEVKRVLKPDGIFCLSEGVPPDICVEDFYKEVFKLKEKRKTFFPKDLFNLMKMGRFREIKMKEFVIKQCSINNWLDNDYAISNETKRKIFRMHVNLHEDGKKAYNMKIADNDCFIDMKFIIISGRK